MADPASPPADDPRTRQIVEAAYALLEVDGLDGLTVRAVLTRAGLARRAFYERFAGKQDLVLALFEHAIRMAAELYAQQVAGIADPMERLKLVVTSLALGTGSPREAGDISNDRHGAAMSREHLRLADSRPDDLKAALHPLLGLISRLLADGMAAGIVRPGSPDRMAALVYNLVSTTVHAEFLAREPVRGDRARRAALAEDVWQFCRRGIAADGYGGA